MNYSLNFQNSASFIIKTETEHNHIADYFTVDGLLRWSNIDAASMDVGQ